MSTSLLKRVPFWLGLRMLMSYQLAPAILSSFGPLLRLSYCVQVEPSSVREAYGAMRVMVGEALLLLIQKPSAISTLDCPEALLLDLQRLVATQNELQRLSLIGASLLVAQMLLGAKGLPSTPVTAENRRYQLCSQMADSREPS